MVEQQQEEIVSGPKEGNSDYSGETPRDIPTGNPDTENKLEVKIECFQRIS